MSRKDKRFVKTYEQGAVNISGIWVSRETGVNYLRYTAGNGAGLTPLLNRDGKPDITTVYGEE